jgi:hypothetical protein
MRIQETDRILKESRHARNAVASQQHEEDHGVMSRTWRSLSTKLTSLFRRS